MQEVFTLLAMAALAALIIAVGGIVVWHFQDAQKAADWAVAYVYPMAKPVNTTHFWLGAQASFADVKIARVLVDGKEYYTAATAPYGKTVWLNYSGRPLAVKCNSTVAFEVERGKASRSLTFRAVCPAAVKKQSTNLEDIKTMLVSYANFVLDYVVNNHSALLTAYFKHDGVYIRNNWDRPLIVAVDPPIGAFYPDLASLSTGFRIIVLLPGEEHRLIPMDTAGAAVVYYRDTLTTLEFPSLLNRWVYSQIDPLGGNWLLWVNGVQAYNGTAPASGETPQGIPFEIRPGGYYRLGDQNIPPMPWQGWLKFSTKPPSPEKWRPIYIGYAVDKYSVPYTSISRRYTLYVYPGVLLSSDAVDYFAKVGSNATAVWTVMWRLGQDRVYRGFGGASPFLIYEVLAVDNGTRVDIYWYDVRYDKYDEKAVHRDYIIPPGYKVVKAPGGTGMRLLYADANLWVAIADIDLLSMSLAYGAAFDVSVLTFLGFGGVETWVIEDEDTAVLVYSTAQLPRQYYGCYINTNGFRNRFWQWSQYPYYWGIECYWVDLDKGVQRKVTPTVRIETKPLGIWYLNIKVYRDGQLVGDETIYIPWPHPKRILPDYVPIVVTRDNLRTWLWALPAGVSMILGYVPAAQGLAHGGKVYNRAIYGVRITDIASYRYTLDVRAGYNQKLVGEYTDVSGGVTYQLYNVTASGQLTLYLWDQPVAYDAYHGYGYVVAEKPLPPPSIDYFQPSEECIPTTIYKQLPGQKLTDLQLFKMPNGGITGYKITVERKYLKITQGCGIYQEETVWKAIDTATVDGTTLIVVDLESKNKPYCSLNTENKPRDCKKEVRCECDPGE